MYLADRLTIDAPKRTKDGYLVVRARVARVGLYDYAGHEVDPENKHGLRDKAIVKVYRPGDEVFDRASLASFIGKPVTNDHPREAVTAANWRDHARGTIMGAVRDGEYVAFDFLLTDADAIREVENGKRELSNGYAVDLDYTAGTTPDGQAYDAVQRSIRGNHCALVKYGRAGSECAIKDGFPVCDAITADALDALSASLHNDRKDGTMPHTLTIDGLQVPNVSDEAKACIEKLQGQIADGAKALTDAQAAHDKAMAAKDAEIDDLKGKVVDQKQIDALADAKAAVVADAKKIAGDKLGDTAGKTVADVRRMAVAAKLGDAAVSDKSDDYIEARFDGLKDAGSTDTQTVANLAPAKPVNDAAVISTIRAARYA